MTREEACLKIHEVFKAELGVHETPGPEATARIVEYDKHTTLKATSDEVAWCSAACNFVVETAGFIGTHSAAARSWLDWGVHLNVPIVGCIVIFDRRDANNPNAAHVTTFDRFVDAGTLCCLGGNQSDSVKLSNFPIAKVLGYRAPL